MPVQILSPQRHRHLGWTPFSSYKHAGDRNIVEIAAAEISKAALAFPLAFIHQQGHWSLNAVLGLTPRQNLFLTADGHWVGAYVPASLRAHPFHLGWEGTEANLCIDEASDLLVSDGSGEPIFAENGRLSSSVEQVWSFLSATASSLLALEEGCSALVAAGVIEPWSITIEGPDGSQTLQGLHRVNEAALVGLEGTSFAELGRSGLVGIAYAQMLSMGNLAQLGSLARARIETNTMPQPIAPSEADNPPLINLPNDSTIDWDWSKIGR